MEFRGSIYTKPEFLFHFIINTQFCEFRFCGIGILIEWD